MTSKLYCSAMALTCLTLASCSDEPMNDPYPMRLENEKVLFSAFTRSPKHLDPALSYSQDEAVFTYEIYEPPLQYHYLKRPYELIPLTTVSLPEVHQHTVYKIQIKPNILYQDHPAFAKIPGTSDYRYHDLTVTEVKDKHSINDFQYVGTRELTAEDYIYEIKRLADPGVNSPIYGVMENYIVGFKEYYEKLKEVRKNEKGFIDLRRFPLEGVKLIDPYTYEITLKGPYPQFMHWLAMPFFAPIPWEADKFYSQKVLKKHNITLDWFPIGTGPFVLSDNNPNAMMVLEKNKNFHGETYPTEGEPGDEKAGYLINQGKALPLVDKIIFILEKEGIPYWSKFLQGYYDQSGVADSNFDQVFKTMSEEGAELSDEVKAKGITYSQAAQPTVFYWGVNMLDPLVGGLEEKQKKLRQAFSLAFDLKEYINIFLNGTGQVASIPIPEGIFGYIEPNKEDRNNLEKAKKLLSEAGYPNGIDPKTGKTLAVSLDIPVSSGPNAAAQLGWFRKQFEKLGVELIIKASQYSRFQDIMLNGDAQLYAFGWAADYPDPENFMFLFDSENSTAKYRGQNASNYINPAFDQLFQEMKIIDNSEKRFELIQKMNDILNEDRPWIGSYYPTQIMLRQQWVSPIKANPIARNTLKYISIDLQLRSASQKAWNRPILWPIWMMAAGFILLCFPAFGLYYVKTHQKLKLKKAEKVSC